MRRGQAPSFPARPFAAVEADVNHEMVGRTLGGKYIIEEVLGVGGFASVYRARHGTAGRTVAIKVISPEARLEQPHRERFFREARAMAQLQGRSFATLFDYGEDDGLLYMVQEFVDGPTLTQILERRARLSVVQVIRIASQILEALEEAHRLGVIHRDIKPANIMLAKDRVGEVVVKVLDFGLARFTPDAREIAQHEVFHTSTGILLGTPHFMAPEQVLQLPQTGATDQYSLSVLLYRMLTGAFPFTASSSWELLRKHVREHPPVMDSTLGIPSGIAATVIKGLSKRPGDRFTSAAAMRQALLQDAQDHEIQIHAEDILDEIRIEATQAMPAAPVGIMASPTALIQFPAKESQITALDLVKAVSAEQFQLAEGETYVDLGSALTTAATLLDGPGAKAPPIAHSTANIHWPLILITLVFGAVVCGTLLFLNTSEMAENRPPVRVPVGAQPISRIPAALQAASPDGTDVEMSLAACQCAAAKAGLDRLIGGERDRLTTLHAKRCLSVSGLCVPKD